MYVHTLDYIIYIIWTGEIRIQQVESELFLPVYHDMIYCKSTHTRSFPCTESHGGGSSDQIGARWGSAC